MREGVIGELYMAKGLCFKRRRSIGHTPDEPVPPGLNWDLFLEPAQMKPYSKNKFAYNWHWFWDTGIHMSNFLTAVRTRDPKTLTASVEIGVNAANLCHLANISYRLGRKLTFDPVSWTFPGDAEANALATRQYRPPYVVPENV